MIEDQRSWTKLDEAGAKGFSIAEAFKIPKRSEGWNAEHDKSPDKLSMIRLLQLCGMLPMTLCLPL